MLKFVREYWQARDIIREICNSPSGLKCWHMFLFGACMGFQTPFADLALLTLFWALYFKRASSDA